jgi:anti-sigma factor RsiW
MSTTSCAELADRLPDWVAGRLPSAQATEVAAHVGACADCAAQVATLRALLAARPSAPADLAARTRAALRAAEQERVPAPRVGRRWAGWATSVAAVLVLVVGTFVLGEGDPTEATDLGEIAGEESVWIADDGIVAGAPVLDDLSEDALAALLEEMGG